MAGSCWGSIVVTSRFLRVRGSAGDTPQERFECGYRISALEQGIGALILHYGDLMITDRLMAGVIVLSVLGLIFNLFLQFLERKLVPWNRKE